MGGEPVLGDDLCSFFSLFYFLCLVFVLRAVFASPPGGPREHDPVAYLSSLRVGVFLLFRPLIDLHLPLVYYFSEAGVPFFFLPFFISFLSLSFVVSLFQCIRVAGVRIVRLCCIQYVGRHGIELSTSFTACRCSISVS